MRSCAVMMATAEGILGPVPETRNAPVVFLPARSSPDSAWAAPAVPLEDVGQGYVLRVPSNFHLTLASGSVLTCAQAAQATEGHAVLGGPPRREGLQGRAVVCPGLAGHRLAPRAHAPLPARRPAGHLAHRDHRPRRHAHDDDSALPGRTVNPSHPHFPESFRFVGSALTAAVLRPVIASSAAPCQQPCKPGPGHAMACTVQAHPRRAYVRFLQDVCGEGLEDA
jgi:hypothetical protein